MIYIVQSMVQQFILNFSVKRPWPRWVAIAAKAAPTGVSQIGLKTRAALHRYVGAENRAEIDRRPQYAVF